MSEHPTESDWDGEGLDALAPDVDHAAAHAVYEARRRRHRRRLPLVLAGAAAIVAVVVSLIVLPSGDDDAVIAADGDVDARTDDSRPDGSTAVAGDPNADVDSQVRADLDLLAVEPTSDGGPAMGTLRAAVNDDELGALWTELMLAGLPPTGQVDFSQSFVFAVVVPDDACPEALVDLITSGDAFTPDFRALTNGCNQPLIPKIYVATIGRSPFGAGFDLFLAGQEPYGFVDQTLTVDLSVPVQDGNIPATVGEPVGTLDVDPAPGTFETAILDNGSPVWVGRTGSDLHVVSAVLDGPGRMGTLVRYSPDSLTFHAGVDVFDRDGRGLNTGRHIGFTAVERDGEPTQVLPVPRPLHARFGRAETYVDPQLTGDPIPLPDVLSPGWSYLDAALVIDGAGVGRLCTVDETVPVPELATCPDGSLEIDGLGALSSEDGANITTWRFGPTLVHVEENGEIVTVVPGGGQAGRAD